MVTQKQIAHHLGLSQATVAQALSGRGKLREATRQRVLNYAEEAGYIVDHAAASLAGRRHTNARGTFNVAWLTADPVSQINDPILWCARRALNHYGYGFEFLKLTDIERLDTLPRILKARGAGGLIIATQGVTGSYPEQAVWDFLGVPTVALYFGSPHLPFHRVSSDAFREGEQATLKAIERGYRRIGFVQRTRRDTQEVQRLRLGGYLAAHCTHAIAPPSQSIYRMDQPIDEEPDIEQLLTWSRRQRLDCLIFADGAFWKSIPKTRESIDHLFQGVGIISLFVIKQQMAWLTGYSNPAAAVAWTAVRMIDSYIRHPIEYENTAKQPNTVLVRQHWNEGITLPRIE